MKPPPMKNPPAGTLQLARAHDLRARPTPRVAKQKPGKTAERRRGRLPRLAAGPQDALEPPPETWAWKAAPAAARLSVAHGGANRPPCARA